MSSRIMNGATRRMALLAIGVCLMGGLIVLGTIRSEHQAAELRQRLKRSDSETFHIADQFRDHLRRLNNPLYQYGTTHEPALLEQFRQASLALDRWIDEQKPKVPTDKEKHLLQEIDRAYDVYVRYAETLQQRLAAQTQAPVSLDAYRELRLQSQHLFDLGQELAEAHYASREIAVAQTNRTIGQMRRTVLVCLGMIFAFGLGLAALVYRDLIAPLRRRLVESEALVERSEKLASLGLLAAGVAHEIRNPLTAIKAALFLQQKRFIVGTQEFNDSKVVEREILRLERIVNDFLKFARPSEPVFAKVSVLDLLTEVRHLVEPQMAKAEIQFDVEPASGLMIKADSAQIKEVLLNLIQNAVEAVTTHGIIRLRGYCDQRHLNHQNLAAVIIEVSDNGKGISPDVQKRLFDPFFTTKDNGTGLGLAIAASIVEKHGGALEFQSQVNHGTTFGIILSQAAD